MANDLPRRLLVILLYGGASIVRTIDRAEEEAVTKSMFDLLEQHLPKEVDGRTVFPQTICRLADLNTVVRGDHVIGFYFRDDVIPDDHAERLLAVQEEFLRLMKRQERRERDGESWRDDPPE